MFWPGDFFYLRVAFRAIMRIPSSFVVLAVQNGFLARFDIRAARVNVIKSLHLL
ncbi:hypothetical protein FHU29_000252 [Hoyosella altamirensis]|uniref:Uncharacterized protein n=1 Tax=Hoyosella altamirensis TaxID=616997 RepID=A0A839RHV5_9ACTN|nr:hypothetical protein [Hoyosella altamirensis]